MLRSYLLV